MMSKNEKFKNIDEIISCFFLVVLVSITIIGVFARYVLNNPLSWTEEVSLTLFVWLTMMAAASALRKKQHISIDFLVETMPEKIKKKLKMIVSLINISVLLTMSNLGYQLSIQSSNRLTSVLKMPYSYINISVTIGCLFMVFIELGELWSSLKSLKTEFKNKGGVL